MQILEAHWVDNGADGHQPHDVPRGIVPTPKREALGLLRRDETIPHLVLSSLTVMAPPSCQQFHIVHV